MLIELERLEYGAIERLVRGEALAIWVRNFVDEGVAAKLAEQIMGLYRYGIGNCLQKPSMRCVAKVTVLTQRCWAKRR